MCAGVDPVDSMHVSLISICGLFVLRGQSIYSLQGRPSGPRGYVCRLYTASRAAVWLKYLAGTSASASIARSSCVGSCVCKKLSCGCVWCLCCSVIG